MTSKQVSQSKLTSTPVKEKEENPDDLPMPMRKPKIPTITSNLPSDQESDDEDGGASTTDEEQEEKKEVKKLPPKKEEKAPEKPKPKEVKDNQTASKIPKKEEKPKQQVAEKKPKTQEKKENGNELLTKEELSHDLKPSKKKEKEQTPSKKFDPFYCGVEVDKDDDWKNFKGCNFQIALNRKNDKIKLKHIASTGRKLLVRKEQWVDYSLFNVMDGEGGLISYIEKVEESEENQISEFRKAKLINILKKISKDTTGKVFMSVQSISPTPEKPNGGEKKRKNSDDETTTKIKKVEIKGKGLKAVYTVYKTKFDEILDSIKEMPENTQYLEADKKVRSMIKESI
jgi:hypothetical protein